MPKYIVEGMYRLPEWWDIELEAEDETDAEDQALEWIHRSSPEEAVEFEIYDVRVIE